ncbi:hypothetical protein KP509_09G016100 [Ceratopteris richardii]|uniref:Uncharacterized protein n=1 Tax=Ceratopteris richardii TaxID=49495 RepID=A0A8T2U277_CERRI|nr:hypothetical protein KP509_09G016100 [Ceratopteris richardii]
MGRAPCCEKDSVKRGPWTPEEDAKLLACINQYGTGSWRTLPKKAGLQRCGKSCRLRWTNYLRPDLKHGRFSDQEEQLIVKLHAALGSRWSLIAAQLPGRTDNDVKNYWNTRLKKKLCEMGIDPITHKPISQLLADLAGSMTLPKGSEIAEATLGCFKDDMLNVLMRRRSDQHSSSPPVATSSCSPIGHMNGSSYIASSTNATSTNHVHSMSFAPLINLATPIAMSCGPVSPNTSLVSGTQGFAIEKSNPFRTVHMSERSITASSSRRKNCTPVPCGPVSGIRSAAGSVLSARPNAGNRPFNLISHYSAKPETTNDHELIPAYPSLNAEVSNDQCENDVNCSSLGTDHSSCNMLDMLIDSSSNSEMKQVPDLNLMQIQSLSVRRPQYFDPQNCREEFSDGQRDICRPMDFAGNLTNLQVMQIEDFMAEKFHGNTTLGHLQNDQMYTLLLQQQESKPHDKENNYITSATLHYKKIPDMNVQNSMKRNVNNSNTVTVGTTANADEGVLQSWSPVSYTNSGSSSSNQSLSVTPHISAVDTVLTSDALLWDLSELGSMVS